MFGYLHTCQDCGRKHWASVPHVCQPVDLIAQFIVAYHHWLTTTQGMFEVYYAHRCRPNATGAPQKASQP